MNSKELIASWPVNPNFRTSFWFTEENKTCPCEIQSNGEITDVNTNYVITIMLPKVDMLDGKLRPNTKFNIGLHSKPIGEGTIINLIPS